MHGYSGKEAWIHWNGPLTAKADRLGRDALDRLFERGRWHFVTLDNKVDSIVTKKLRSEKPGLPFFWTKNYLFWCKDSQSIWNTY